MTIDIYRKPDQDIRRSFHGGSYRAKKYEMKLTIWSAEHGPDQGHGFTYIDSEASHIYKVTEKSESETFLDTYGIRVKLSVCKKC